MPCSSRMNVDQNRQSIMKDRSSWLSCTVEEAIEPDIEICDSHHHLWDYPGNRYLVEELLTDIAGGHRIKSTVFVECRQRYRTAGPIELQPVGETEFVHQITATHQGGGATTRIAAGIIGFADLTLGASVRQVLEAHLRASDRFRGVRHASAWSECGQIRNAHTDPPRGLLSNRHFRLGFAQLQKLGLSFDAWLYHTQISDLVDLAQAFPDVAIVIDHAGGPLGIGRYAGRRREVFSAWRQDMIELAACHNVVVKLGGLTMTMSGFGWHRRATPPGSAELAQAMKPYYETCIEHFGADRCMFESNFPVDQASCSYVVLWNAFKRIAGNFSFHERSALFNRTAKRIYRLNDPVACSS
jgi:L-fuconolactonase